MLPPCVVDAKDINGSAPCANDECSQDLSAWALKAYTSQAKNLTVLGVAKDGHLIIGPYDENGNQYDCNKIDICGGTFLSNGNYVYVYQNIFPYAFNCFGPGAANTYDASCSTNTCALSSAEPLA